MGMGKGATGIRKEVVEEESSTPVPWCHATTLATGSTRGETKTVERAGTRMIKIGQTESDAKKMPERTG